VQTEVSPVWLLRDEDVEKAADAAETQRLRVPPLDSRRAPIRQALRASGRLPRERYCSSRQRAFHHSWLACAALSRSWRDGRQRPRVGDELLPRGRSSARIGMIRQAAVVVLVQLSIILMLGGCRAEVDCEPAFQVLRGARGDIASMTPSGLERCGPYTWNSIEDVACRCPDQNDCGCLEDDDCEAGETCICTAIVMGEQFNGTLVPRNSCLPARCQTAADCGGSQCGVAIPNAATSAPAGLMCRADGDACITDSDCGLDGGCLGDFSVGEWTCARSTTFE
jgi:hypothetical protein